MAERSGGMGLGGRRLKLVGNFLDVGDHVRAVTRFTVFVQAFFPTLLLEYRKNWNNWPSR